MSNSDLFPTLYPNGPLVASTSTVNAFPDAVAKRPRDTTNRLEVRMHRSTTFLAIAYKGNLWEFFPRRAFYYNPDTAARTSVKWHDTVAVTPILFGLLAYRKTPYRASKGEPL